MRISVSGSHVERVVFRPDGREYHTMTFSARTVGDAKIMFDTWCSRAPTGFTEQDQPEEG